MRNTFAKKVIARITGSNPKLVGVFVVLRDRLRRLAGGQCQAREGWIR
jgi:hypothetical protein